MIDRRVALGIAGAGAAAFAGFFAGRQTAAPPEPPVPAADPAPALPTEIDLSPEAARNFRLATATVARRPLARSIRVTGVVALNELRLAHINPLARGRVQVMEVAVGQRVRAGERLAILDALDLAEARHQLASAQAALRQAGAEAATARAALQRGRDLVRGGALAQSELDRRQSDMARAEAAVQTRTVEAEHWREMLERYSPALRNQSPAGDAGSQAVSLAAPSPEDARGAILAPFDGTILSIGATPGELVDTNREIFALADLGVMWVQADVPERDLGALQIGAAASIAVEAYPGRRFPGVVAYVADQLDARTGTAKVRCEIANPDGALKANMFAVVEIAAPLGRDGLVVPDAAVQSVDGQEVVFVRLAETRFGRRDVRLGLRAGGVTEVIDGVAADQVVATEGSFRLKALLLGSRFAAED
jgi:cobalt-zinc-cadmium efflux system membrane fusion protein